MKHKEGRTIFQQRAHVFDVKYTFRGSTDHVSAEHKGAEQAGGGSFWNDGMNDPCVDIASLPGFQFIGLVADANRDKPFEQHKQFQLTVPVRRNISTHIFMQVHTIQGEVKKPRIFFN